jgi:hypothetical protein
MGGWLLLKLLSNDGLLFALVAIAQHVVKIRLFTNRRRVLACL